MTLPRLLFALPFVLAAAPAAADPAIAARVQAIYDPVGQTVTRRLVRVVDPSPGLGLDFTWEPAAGNVPGVDAEGFATGPGRLVWRIPGAAAHDPRALHESYTGEMRRGLYEGTGELIRRDGSRLSGRWAGGVQDGEGRRLDAAGNLYEGTFRAGLPEGRGRLLSREGWTYEGPFRAGLPQGEGVVLRAGVERRVRMERGAEVWSEPAADPTLGGLRPAQGGPSQAERVAISVYTDQRVSLRNDIRYGHAPDGSGGLAVYIEDEELSALWAGTGTLTRPGILDWAMAEDWQAARAFLDIDLAAQDGRPVTLASYRLAFDYSLPNLRPMLVTEGCGGGYHPVVGLFNVGWGAAENVRFTLAFGPEGADTAQVLAGAPGLAAGATAFPAGPIDRLLDLDLGDMLAAAGVDTARLAAGGFRCEATAVTPACEQGFRAAVRLGGAAPFAVFGGGGDVRLPLHGRIAYDWRDGTGGLHHAEELFTETVALAHIQTLEGAEMGGAGAFAAPAPEFIPLELPPLSGPWEVEIPRRGSPAVTRLFTQVKMWAAQSSQHRFRVEARFADGSARSSAPVTLYVFRPRLDGFPLGLYPDCGG